MDLAERPVAFPKYLAGESYGTARASALAAYLQREFGLFCNGIMLISSVIDMGTIRFTEGNDLPHVLFLPTYAALAHYHGQHGSRPLHEVIDEAVALAAGPYLQGLASGSRLPTADRADLIRRVAGVTGLAEDYVRRVNLRIEHLRFFRELLRHQGKVIGRLDGRFTGYEPDDGGERPSDDPSNVAIRGPYAAALNHYVRADLGYSSDLPYELLTGRVQPWSYADFEGRHVSVSAMLGEALRHNPHLRIYVACGYYDGATPFFGAEHAFAHLDIPDELRSNLSFEYFEAGHMMYVHEPSRLQQSATLAAFVGSVPPGPRRLRPPRSLAPRAMKIPGPFVYKVTGFHTANRSYAWQTRYHRHPTFTFPARREALTFYAHVFGGRPSCTRSETSAEPTGQLRRSTAFSRQPRSALCRRRRRRPLPLRCEGLMLSLLSTADASTLKDWFSRLSGAAGSWTTSRCGRTAHPMARSSTGTVCTGLSDLRIRTDIRSPVVPGCRTARLRDRIGDRGSGISLTGWRKKPQPASEGRGPT